MWLNHLKTEVDVDDEVMFYVGIVTKHLKRGTITGFKKGYVQVRGENGYPYPYVLPEDITMLLTENGDNYYQEDCTSPSYDDSYDDNDYDDSPCINGYDDNYDCNIDNDDSYSSSNYDNYSSSNDSSFDCSSSNDW